MANLFQCATSHIKKKQHSESENNLLVELEKWKKGWRRRDTLINLLANNIRMWHSFVLEQIISFSRKKKFPVFFSHKLNKWANKLEKKKITYLTFIALKFWIIHMVHFHSCPLSVIQMFCKSSKTALCYCLQVEVSLCILQTFQSNLIQWKLRHTESGTEASVGLRSRAQSLQYSICTLIP